MIARETPFSALEKIEKVRRVNRFLMHLKPEYREVLVLREYQNMTYEEIAAVTDATISSVKSRLFKARRKLGNYLAPFNEDVDSNGQESDSKEVSSKSA
jgi:RNA polymerase sigma-70 factor (ECF subfamily)